MATPSSPVGIEETVRQSYSPFGIGGKNNCFQAFPINELEPLFFAIIYITVHESVFPILKSSRFMWPR